MLLLKTARRQSRRCHGHDTDDTKWFHPDAMDDHAPTLLGELDERQMFIGLKLYCKMLKGWRTTCRLPQWQLVHERC